MRMLEILKLLKQVTQLHILCLSVKISYDQLSKGENKNVTQTDTVTEAKNPTAIFKKLCCLDISTNHH